MAVSQSLTIYVLRIIMKELPNQLGALSDHLVLSGRLMVALLFLLSGNIAFLKCLTYDMLLLTLSDKHQQDNG